MALARAEPDDSRVKLGPQRLQHHHPVTVRGQATSGGAADAMPAVELDIERIDNVAARADGYPDAVLKRRRHAARVGIGMCLALRLVQLKADLRKIVQLRDGAP